MQKELDIAELLASAPFFSGLDLRKRKRLAKLFVPRNYPAGTNIIKEGTTGLGMFFITEGTVEVYKTEGGKKIPIANLSNNDVLGEMSLIDDEPRSASATASENCECLLLTRDSFRRLVAKDTEIAWSLVPVLAKRLREAQDRLVKSPEPKPESATDHPQPPIETPIENSQPEEETPKETVMEAQTKAETTGTSDGPMAGFGKMNTNLSEDNPYLGTVGWRLPFTMFLGGSALMKEMMGVWDVVVDTMAKKSGLAEGSPPTNMMMQMPQAMIDTAQACFDRSKEVPGNTMAQVQSQMSATGDGDDDSELD